MIDHPAIFHAQCRPPKADANAGGSGLERFRGRRRGRDATRDWTRDLRQPRREVGA